MVWKFFVLLILVGCQNIYGQSGVDSEGSSSESVSLAEVAGGHLFQPYWAQTSKVNSTEILDEVVIPKSELMNKHFVKVQLAGKEFRLNHFEIIRSLAPMHGLTQILNFQVKWSYDGQETQSTLTKYFTSDIQTHFPEQSNICESTGFFPKKNEGCRYYGELEVKEDRVPRRASDPLWVDSVYIVELIVFNGLNYNIETGDFSGLKFARIKYIEFSSKPSIHGGNSISN